MSDYALQWILIEIDIVLSFNLEFDLNDPRCKYVSIVNGWFF